LIETLRTEASQWLKQPAATSVEWQRGRRYSIASQLEDALDVFAEDPATSRMLLCQAVSAMLEYFVHVETGRAPRGKDLLAVVAQIDPGVGRHAGVFYSAGELAAQRAAAELLADRILMTRGFFEWESEKEPV
jgi:hypothetical protein